MSAQPPSGPVTMADVMRELRSIASAAERSGDAELLAAGRRLQSMLARLRDQFVEELVGEGAPSARAA